MRLLCSLVLLIACFSSAFAADKPQVIVCAANADRLVDLAARELQRYLYLASGTLLPIVPESDKPAFRLWGPESWQWRPIEGITTSADPAEAKRDWGEDSYLIGSPGGQAAPALALVAAPNSIGVLYGVYDLLERYGFAFTLGGDVIPDKKPLEFLPIQLEKRKPALKIRGSLPWYNFLDSPTTWNLADHKRFYDQMAKMRMNFVGFHAYDYEPFTAVKVDGQYRYGQPLQNTRQGVWGTVPMKTAEFGFGTGDCFSREYFGAEPSFDYKTPDEGVEKAQAMLAEGLKYARERGIHVCVGFEVGGDPSDPNNERDLELRLKHLVEQYPMVEYVWLWQSEGRGGGGEQAVPPAGTLFGNYYRQVHHQFDYLADPSRIAEACRISYYAYLGRTFLQRWAPGVRLIVSGWGGDRWMRFSDFYVGLDKTLPPDVIFAALDNIDPSWSPQVSHAYGEVSPQRERWPIPWFESDGGGSHRDQWGPQCSTKPFSALCRDALKKGCQGLLGIHWRTRGVEEAMAYVARFAWEPELTYQQFYDSYAARCFGPQVGAEMGVILRDLEALGPRWTGALGQVECGGFEWFSSPDRPKPENMAKLAQIEQRLVQLREAATPRHRGRVDALLHTIRWLTKYDTAALKLQPGGEVEKAIREAEAAKAAGAADAAEKAAAALAALRGSGLADAFNELPYLLITQGDAGSLATANGKAYAAYRALEQRIARLSDQPLPPEASPLHDLQVAVTPTPDRLEAGEPLVVRASVRSDQGPVAGSLWWRPLGDAGDFREVKMAPDAWVVYTAMAVEARAVYLATVPGEALSAPGVEFFVAASDAAGRKATLPVAGAEGPFSAVVLPPRERIAWPAPRPSDQAPPGPAALKATDAGPYQVALSWRADGDAPARTWQVWRGEGEEMKLLAEPRLPGFVDMSVKPNAHLTYSVRAVGWNGDPGPEKTVAFDTPAYPPPSPPTGVWATPGVHSIRLSWKGGDPGVAAYRIRRLDLTLRTQPGPGIEVPSFTVPATGGQKEVFLDEPVGSDADYAYRVEAISLGGGLSQPSERSATVRAWDTPHPALTMSLDGSLDPPHAFAVHAEGAPEFVAAGQRQALRLGADKWLAFDDRPEFDIPDAITLEAWAKFDDVGGIPVLISHARWEQTGYFLQVLGGGVRFHVALTGAVLVFDAGRVTPGEWHHVAGTFDGKTARIYVDGNLAGTLAAPPSAGALMNPYHGPLYVGRYEDLGPQYEVHGLVAEVGVFAGAKSAEQIKAEYEAQKGRFGP